MTKYLSGTLSHTYFSQPQVQVEAACSLNDIYVLIHIRNVQLQHCVCVCARIFWVCVIISTCRKVSACVCVCAWDSQGIISHVDLVYTTSKFPLSPSHHFPTFFERLATALASGHYTPQRTQLLVGCLRTSH